MKPFFRIFIIILLNTWAILAQNGGYAVKFNGVDGFATSTMNTGNTNSTTTVEMWFTQISAQAGTQYLADFRSISGTNNRRVMPYLNNSIIGIFCAPNTGDDNNAITQSTGVTVSQNVWYHIAVTINSSTLKMYVNGKLYITTSLTDAYALTGTEVLTLASDYTNSIYANIKADEVRVWSTERSEAQIKANMYKELVGNEAGLMSYYKMSNGSGAALSDNQISGTYGGVLSGGYTWVASGAFADNKNALDFDGSNDYVDCGNSPSVQRNGTQSFTVEAWVKPTGGGVWVAVISKFVHTASNEGYSLEIFTDNKVSLLYGNNWADWNATTSTVALTPGVWSHIASTYDGTTVKIYINGLLTQSATWTNGLTDSGTDLLLGARSGTTFYWGQMDEARVWTVARTQVEIQESMCRTLVGNEAGLAAYYRLDQIDGSVTYDLTSNANNGTLTNMDPATDWVDSDAFNTWIGAESSSWSTAGNWSKGASPISSNSAGIYKWALGNDATLSTSPTINNLFISSTSSPTLSSAATINMNFLLGKDFNLNGQTVTLGSSANLVEGSYRLYGSLGTITTTRNLSNISSLDVAGLGAKITTAANMGSTTISRGHSQQSGNGNISILRYYDITPTNNSALNATLVFNYNDNEFNSLTENNFVLFKSIDSGTNWTNQGGTLSAANNTLTKTAIPSFSRWTIGDNSLPLVNSNPVLASIEGTTLNYNEGDGAVQISSTIAVSDADNTNLASATVQITSNYQNGQDVLNFTNQNGISGSWNSINGTMTLTGSSLVANYQTALRAVQYTNSSNNPTVLTRTVTYTVNDGVNSSNTQTRNISVTAVNNSPVLADIENTAISLAENASAVQITNSITINDVDNTNLASATVKITSGYQNGDDVLSFANQNGINGSWNASTGTMTLTGSSLVANYQIALRSILFKNIGYNPSPLKTISFTISDGSAGSNTISRNITINVVNDPPAVTNIEPDRLIYKKGSKSEIITNTIRIEDVDNTNMAGAEVKIENNFSSSEDYLTFDNVTGIQGNFDSNTGILTFTGSVAISEYENILRSVAYENVLGVNASNIVKSICFTVNDGSSNSSPVYREIEITSPVNSPANLTLQINAEENVDLKWDDMSENEDGFIIYRFYWPFGSQGEIQASIVPIDTVESNITVFTDTDVLEGCLISYHVLAYMKNGALSDADPNLIQSISTPLKTPTELKASGSSFSTIELSWKDNSKCEEMYIIERSEDNNINFNNLTSVVSDSKSYSDKNIQNGKKYYYRLYAIKNSLKSRYSNEANAIGLSTGISLIGMDIPKEYKMYQNYPNPFNPTTMIRFGLPFESEVKAVVYNILGEEIKEIISSNMAGGTYSISWNAANVPSGIYFLRITANSLDGRNKFSKIQKMLLIK